MLATISDTSLLLLAAGASGVVFVTIVLGLWLVVRPTGGGAASLVPSTHHASSP